MSANPDDPIVKKTGILFDVLRVCEQAARSLNDVGDGLYRDNIVASLANTIEFAADTLDEVHTALSRPVERKASGQS